MMTINLSLIQPIVALVGGALILFRPQWLRCIVAAYLIVAGIAGLWPHLVRL